MCLDSFQIQINSQRFKEIQGQRIQPNGNTRLVGVSIVPKSGNQLLDKFLNLPTAALAILNCELID